MEILHRGPFCSAPTAVFLASGTRSRAPEVSSNQNAWDFALGRRCAWFSLLKPLRKSWSVFSLFDLLLPKEHISEHNRSSTFSRDCVPPFDRFKMPDAAASSPHVLFWMKWNWEGKGPLPSIKPDRRGVTRHSIQLHTTVRRARERAAVRAAVAIITDARPKGALSVSRARSRARDLGRCRGESDEYKGDHRDAF